MAKSHRDETVWQQRALSSGAITDEIPERNADTLIAQGFVSSCSRIWALV
jgi:hypothetical protein